MSKYFDKKLFHFVSYYFYLMLEKSLPNYEALSQLSESEISSKGERLVYYDELVVDISKFSHPGSDSLLNSWLGSDV